MSSVAALQFVEKRLRSRAPHPGQNAEDRRSRPAALSPLQTQWQPAQEEQLPVQPASGWRTAMGSPPFMAVLMMASM